MWERARQEFPGPRVVLCLDADEMLTAGAASTRSWQKMLEAPPGTSLQLQWINLLPDGTAWLPPVPKPFGLVDDGSGPDPSLHPRQKASEGSGEPLVLDEIGVLHLQHLDWANMKSKQRWYQAWDRVQNPERRPITVYRTYHWMDALAPSQVIAVDERWFAEYAAAGIDLLDVEPLPNPTWQDREVVVLIDEHGPETFRHVDLWDHDWSAAAAACGRTAPVDPRSRFDRLVLRFLAQTQGRRRRLPRRVVERALAVAGW